MPPLFLSLYIYILNHLQFLKPIEIKIEPQRKEKLLPSIKLKKKPH